MFLHAWHLENGTVNSSARSLFPVQTSVGVSYETRGRQHHWPWDITQPVSWSWGWQEQACRWRYLSICLSAYLSVYQSFCLFTGNCLPMNTVQLHWHSFCHTCMRVQQTCWNTGDSQLSLTPWQWRCDWASHNSVSQEEQIIIWQFVLEIISRVHNLC